MALLSNAIGSFQEHLVDRVAQRNGEENVQEKAVERQDMGKLEENQKLWKQCTI